MSSRLLPPLEGSEDQVALCESHKKNLADSDGAGQDVGEEFEEEYSVWR